MSITIEQVLIAVLAVVAAIAAAKFLFRKDEEQEERRLKYAEVGDWCAELKLPRLSEIFNRLAVGDYSGAARAIRSLVDLLTQGGDARTKALDPAFWHQLTLRLQDPEQAAKIREQVQKTADSEATAKQRQLQQLLNDPDLEIVEE